jgi:CubicO group peptidase (beta-lactamase class C family)
MPPSRCLPVRLTLLLAMPVVAPLAQRPVSRDMGRRIDDVFAPYQHADAPGCALGVYQRGAITYARGYGAANLEFRAPITPGTPFIMGSVSKQFTAGAIALLVEEGRLSLDDDVRRYVPELPDYGARITIDHLVHHTSGLRDFWALTLTSGRRPDDGYTVDDVLRLAIRQRHLDFPPGTAYEYSNTGYVLLGLVVQRVAGMSLRAFAAARIFGPLGMTHTQYHDDHTEPVPGRADAYRRRPDGGWAIDIWDNDIVGQGGLMTTVDDLVRWDENFYSGKVGGPGFLARQLQQGRLSDGSTIPYAFGLTVGSYRGLPMVEHGGSTGGYRTVLTRFPATHTSVAIMCNEADANPVALAHRVADVVLDKQFTAAAPAVSGTPAPPAPARATVPTDRLAAVPGRYRSDELDAVFDVAVAGGALLVSRGPGLVDTLPAVDPWTFRRRDLTIRFPETRAAGAASFLLDVGRARGLTFVRVEPR